MAEIIHLNRFSSFRLTSNTWQIKPQSEFTHSNRVISKRTTCNLSTNLFPSLVSTAEKKTYLQVLTLEEQHILT